MDQQDMTTDNADTAWPEISADVTMARGTARSITLDTQRASTDGRIIEMTGQLEQMRGRLSSLEDHIFDVDATASHTQEYADRFASLDQEINETAARFEALATRVAAAEEGVATTMIASVDGFDSRLVLVEDARLSQSNELNELTSYLEQAFTRIAELAEVIEEERTSNSSARNNLTEQSSAFANSIDARIDELHASVADLTSQLQHATTSIDSSANDIQDALAISVEELQNRVAATETQVSQLGDISSSIQFLAARADAFESQQDGINANQASRTELVELAGNVEHANARIDETQQGLVELRTQFSEPQAVTSSPELAAELDGLRSAVSSSLDAHDIDRVALSRNREDINTHGTAIERGETENAATRQLVQDVSDRIGNMAENSELIGHRVDLVQGAADDLHERVEEMRSSSNSLGAHVEHIDANVHTVNSRLDNAATALDAAHSRLDEAESTAQSAHARIDQTAQELSTRFEESAQAVNERLYETNQELDARLGHTADHMNSLLDEKLGEVNRSLEEKVGHVDQRLDEKLGEVNRSLEEKVGHVDHRLDEKLGEVNRSLEEKVGHVDHRLEEADQRLEEKLGHVDHRLEEADQRLEEKLGDVDHRLEETIGQQLGETVGQLNHRFDSNAEEVRLRLASIEDDFGNADGRIQNIELESAAATERATQNAAKLDQTIDCVEGAVAATAEISQRVSSVETRSGDNDLAVTNLEQRVAEAEHALSASDERFGSAEQHMSSNEERISAGESKFGEHDDHFEHIEDRISQTHAHIEERSGAIRDHLLSRIDEARTQLQSALAESQANANESATDLEHSVFERLEVVEQAIETRVMGLEAALSSSDQEPRLEFLETSVAAVETRANEAYAFTESLRQLQTDIVQALQEELRSHEGQIGGFDGRLQHLESSGDDYASGERVHMLEAKLVEALQTISQLTQLQRRNTTVEAQLTDTLTATSHGVESTQHNIVQLREELASAQQRIGHLEQRLSAAQTSTAMPPPSDQAAQLDEPRQLPVPNSNDQAITAAEDDADTGWFTESYARKNEEPKAS